MRVCMVVGRGSVSSEVVSQTQVQSLPVYVRVYLPVCVRVCVG